MRRRSPLQALLLVLCSGIAWIASATTRADAGDGFRLRIVAANLTGNSQKYEAPAERILRSLSPDVVAIQEFNRGGNQPADFTAFVRDVFGPEFSWYREPAGSIPNGIISRWPLRAAGSWDDTRIPDRGFAWAQIDLPGEEDLYVVSVHLKAGGSDAATRAAEAVQLRGLIVDRFPVDALIVIAGDFNLYSRSESALTTLKTVADDQPIPTDQAGNPNTNNGRSRPYDLILNSPGLTRRSVPVRLAGREFATGLVFDSRVFQGDTPLPALRDDSGQLQHMAVVKDYLFEPVAPPAAPTAHLEIGDRPVLTWNAPAGQAWQVETSGDLREWLPAGLVLSGSTNYRHLPEPSPLPSVFFRLRRIP